MILEENCEFAQLTAHFNFNVQRETNPEKGVEDRRKVLETNEESRTESKIPIISDVKFMTLACS